MTIPIKVTDDNTVYFVDIHGDSGNKGSISEDLDEYIRRITYTRPLETRKQINAIRQSVNVVVNNTCMKYRRKLKFTNANGMREIQKACEIATDRMREIDPSLSITPEFMEQTFAQLNNQNMFELMKQELSTQVLQKALDKVEGTLKTYKRADGTIKPITSKTRTALLGMIEEIQEIGTIIPDETLSARIEAIKDQIIAGTLLPMRDNIISMIEDTTEGGRFSNLEITSDMDDAALINNEVSPPQGENQDDGAITISEPMGKKSMMAKDLEIEDNFEDLI